MAPLSWDSLRELKQGVSFKDSRSESYDRLIESDSLESLSI